MRPAFSSSITPVEYTVILHVVRVTSIMPCLWWAMVQMRVRELITGSSKTGIYSEDTSILMMLVVLSIHSWGRSWGSSGYMKMIRNKNMCGVATAASYPTL